MWSIVAGAEHDLFSALQLCKRNAYMYVLQVIWICVPMLWEVFSALGFLGYSF